jgi:hypothetical protein
MQQTMTCPVQEAIKRDKKGQFMNDVTKQSNDALLQEVMDWIRIGRNEGGLSGDERKHFQKVCKEVGKRKLLKIPAEYRGKE